MAEENNDVIGSESNAQVSDDTFDQLKEVHLDLLEELSCIQSFNKVLFQHEAQRLANKYGEAHPQAKRMNDTLKLNEDLGPVFEVGLEIAKIRVPEVPAKGALVHGRVVDESDRGLAGLSVFGESEESQKLRIFGSAETDPSGYYAIQVDKDTLKRLEKTQVYLAVSTRVGKIIHREEEPLELTPDSKTMTRIVLRREDLGPPMPKTPPEEPSGPEVSPDKKGVKDIERTDIGALKGIGPKTVEKLRKAGIKDVGTFVEKDDAELQTIMGTINVARIRKDNATLLARARKSKGE